MLGNWARLLLAAGFALALAVPARAGTPTLDVYAPHWEGYTNPDGSGMGWEVVRAVYEPAGVRVRFHTVPYQRAVVRVKNGEADAWLASYAHEQTGVIYPDWHYDADRVSAVMMRAEAAAWTGVAALRNRRVAWMPAYNMDQYLDVPVDHVSAVASHVSALRMLKAGRIDYFLGAAYEIENSLESLPDDLSRSTFTVEHAFNLKLYPGFARTEAGRRFAAIWDRRIPALLANGTLARIYDAHDFEVWPFDVPREP
ncbi:amino acid ABC transporter substrate-binding protein, PAAT family [Limimonas halophila]|uniref:Amino acid ABC transporter substrate-binding protein, PAAT family n=1 Tax=Limimonas halophila TaxID=1082479 RepID=A0A1G7LZ73_9PROT|nr:transporter substrate-binding domain-containing protein [Limimonas halophila]SDF54259.1 amino acid ABC transporter substrate-binding protein, PAAT family [Limimonas halophila]